MNIKRSYLHNDGCGVVMRERWQFLEAEAMVAAAVIQVDWLLLLLLLMLVVGR